MTSNGNGAAHESRPGKKGRRGGRRADREAAGAQFDSGSSQTTEKGGDEYQYKHPKPRVLTSSLFMWEHVAVFSMPAQVAELERVSRDVARLLKDSNTGTHPMQRYWNAQWSRIVWKEEELSDEKKYLAPTMLTRSEGKRKWKNVFVQEYPLYLKRVYQGKGVCNNAVNAAKVLFNRQVLNAAKTAAELEQMELTVEEARVKEQKKRGVDVEFEDTPDTAPSPSSLGCHHGSYPAKGERERHEKGRPRAVKKAPHETYTRSDYKEDYRTGDRKGKHKKGGTGRWSKFDDFGDYNY
ncbi:hypothetical protein conserved [Leishmania donovani]|nr:hypothetical protein, conserved [Leishmania donovani]AYU78915.1 hypothetical protein LdCL_230009300 [Leishmania donovani]TPP51387.1 hypothetical protein CGC20_18395 [Leishmania donovani]CAJ1988913.1 hypothetical protein conserved [Leishmania donovani]CBZ34235.1 hypothetical protein, conserved [Leishmania donovani]VDZ44791.1 hypothetical_protein_conserved [Leishmania donovani]